VIRTGRPDATEGDQVRAMRGASGTRRGDRARPWLAGVLRCGAVLLAAALAVVPLTATSANAAGTATGTTTAGPQTLTQAEAALQPVLNQLHTDYQQTEVETQKYDALSEQLVEAQSDDDALQVAVQNGQAQVNDGVTLAGEIADAEYRNGSLSQLGELLLAADPEQAVHTQQLLAMVGRSQGAFLKQLKADQASLVAAKDAADIARQHAAQLVAAEGAVRNEINKQLAAVERRVSTLTGAQRQELQLLEQREASAAQLALLASGALGQDDAKPSQAGAQAIAFAFQQLGAPYVWGGIGPYAQGFDCSGLTSQAWLSAGVAIPRTSEEQWADLPHVALDALRPGDLIIYFSGASHVAMYIGGGEVIEAPHPGAFVDVEPMAVNPILGAVRPDPGNGSLGSYTPPVIPPSATLPPPIAPTPPAPPVTPPSHPKPPTHPKPPVKPTAPPTGKPTTGASGSPSATPSASSTPSATPSAPDPVSPSPSADGAASAPASSAASDPASGSASGPASDPAPAASS
jgi:peptidoglycan DL-endopeptidase CwlO